MFIETKTADVEVQGVAPEKTSEQVDIKSSVQGEAPEKPIGTESTKVATETTSEKGVAEADDDKGGEKQVQFDEKQQALLNSLLKKEKEKTLNQILSKAGVKSVDELENVKEKLDKANTSREEFVKLREDLALIKNNIKPGAVDVVKAYFKGKGKELTPETLETELKENGAIRDMWVSESKPTIKHVGTTPEDEKNNSYVEFKEKVGKFF